MPKGTKRKFIFSWPPAILAVVGLVVGLVVLKAIVLMSFGPQEYLELPAKNQATVNAQNDQATSAAYAYLINREPSLASDYRLTLVRKAPTKDGVAESVEFSFSGKSSAELYRVVLNNGKPISAEIIGSMIE